MFLSEEQLRRADNMTDAFAALKALSLLDLEVQFGAAEVDGDTFTEDSVHDS